MLNKLLVLILERGTARTTELADELGVDPGLVRGMLEQLVRQGYLESVVQGCSQACTNCLLHDACGLKHRPRIWSLTVKGRQVLERRHRGVQYKETAID